MKLKTCPYCKLRVPAHSKVCPVCGHTYTKFEYFRMNFLKYVITAVILSFILYNAIVIIHINKQIRNYIKENNYDSERVEKLETKYDNLTPLQKRFVHSSEIDYLKEHIDGDLKTKFLQNQTLTVYLESGSKEGIYSGEVFDNQPEGKGTFAYVDDDGIECVYEGEFTNNSFNGEGTLTKGNGEVYSGNFVSGKMNGKGQYFNENGELIYEGTFVNNVLSGKGTMYSPDGFKIYSGEFSKGIPSENLYISECTEASPIQLYNDTSSYVRTNVSLSGIVTDISVTDSGIVQYVLTSINGSSNNVCIQYYGRSKNIYIGNTITVYGYCNDAGEYYMESGARKNGIIITAFYINNL
ncbi:MAG: hypothetical protein SOZ34_00065 [Clostridia bacterium]|nr:hypothetical protein [Clostridia bacterium]